MKERKKNGLMLEILLSLSPAPPAATAAELADDLLPGVPLDKARQSISQQLWQLRVRGWNITKDPHGHLLLDRQQYRLLLDWSRRRTTALGCYGVQPLTPANLQRFCALLLPDGAESLTTKDAKGTKKKATTEVTEKTEKGNE